MSEFVIAIQKALAVLTEYDWTVACIAVAIAAMFIREMLDSAMLAIFSAPLMLAGALAANYLFHANYVPHISDPDTNVVIASAIGVLVAVTLLLLSMWLVSLMSEKRVKRRRLTGLPPQSTHN